MKNIKFVYKPKPKIVLSAKEVIKIINDKPHLLLLFEISGGYFPHLARKSVVRIKYSRKKNHFEICWFSNISKDNRSIYAYFPVRTKISGIVEYGYGNEIFGRVTKKAIGVKIFRLDRKKVDKETVIVTKKYLKNLTRIK